MSKEDIDQHARKYSQSFSSSYSPWKKNYEEMAKKTVIKKVLKYAPVKADFARAITSDESIKSELSVDMSEVVNEQEVETVDAEYSEVPSDETSENESVSNESVSYTHLYKPIKMTKKLLQKNRPILKSVILLLMGNLIPEITY